MKKNLRPGYLAGFHGLVPKHASAKKTGFGSFGKGMYVPPPAPPSGSVVAGVVDASTGQPYMQDSRCPTGQKMTQENSPCEGEDCDPGETETHEECGNDPNYKQIVQSQPVQQQQQQQPQPAPQPQPQAQVQAAPTPTQEPSAPIGPTAAQEAELLKLSQQAAATSAMVTRVPMLAPPSAYTGSPPPSSAPPRTKAPDDQQKLMELVSEYKAERPAARPRTAMRATPREETESSSSGMPDIFGWFKTTLFGSTDGLGGWSDNKAVRYGVPLVALIAIGFVVMKSKE
jgi:hypothetical protein